MATKTTKATSVNVKPIELHNAITEKLCLELLLLVTQELSSQNIIASHVGRSQESRRWI